MAEAIERVQMNFRLPRSVAQLWDDTAAKMGVNRTAALTIALRDLAKKEGVQDRPVEAREEATA